MFVQPQQYRDPHMVRTESQEKKKAVLLNLLPEWREFLQNAVYVASVSRTAPLREPTPAPIVSSRGPSGSAQRCFSACMQDIIRHSHLGGAEKYHDNDKIAYRAALLLRMLSLGL